MDCKRESRESVLSTCLDDDDEICLIVNQWSLLAEFRSEIFPV